MKYTALSHAMRDLTEELNARRTQVIRLTDPLAGAAPTDAPEARIDPVTGMNTTESPTTAAAAYADLDAAVKEWQKRVGDQASKPVAEVVVEAQKAGRSLGEVTTEMMLRAGKHYDAPDL
jgi:hypothetical protein